MNVEATLRLAFCRGRCVFVHLACVVSDVKTRLLASFVSESVILWKKRMGGRRGSNQAQSAAG